ncbi:MAG TPA: RNA-binding transcriptional accessory protein, partial [Candidatus Marinimicrobia bacterium]|nr:RNA-binding transcriptional accessory protein [Candidatus Neomarinimicrobiota bacterium]
MIFDKMIHTVAAELQFTRQQVANTVQLLDEDNTVPFIARYRKERTGELNEESIRAIQQQINYLRSLEKRKATVLKSIAEQGKLTPELKVKIESVTKLQDLEDIYLPYKPKKRTRATIAKEKGLQALADLILNQETVSGDPLEYAQRFINPEKEVNSAAEALAGAGDIIAETIAEDADIRKKIREFVFTHGSLTATARDESA